MTDIQKARDVLQRWRDDSDGGSPGAWRIDGSASIFPTVRDRNLGEVAEYLLSDDARLIVGTAGNPELLDAIDALLAGEATTTDPDVYVVDLAAAIIAADEGMSA